MVPSVPGSPSWAECVSCQGSVPGQINHSFLFNLSHKCDIQELQLALAGNLCLWETAVCVDFSAALLHPSLPNAMSSLAHRSMAAETPVLTQGSRNSFCCLFTVWSRSMLLCVSQWKNYIFLSPDTWSDRQHCWFIPAFNSCASRPGRSESRLLEEWQNSNV